jgi:hypothetical protein
VLDQNRWTSTCIADNAPSLFYSIISGRENKKMIEIVLHEQNTEYEHKVTAIGRKVCSESYRPGFCQVPAIVAQAIHQPEQEKVLKRVPDIISLENDVRIRAQGKNERHGGDAAAPSLEFENRLPALRSGWESPPRFWACRHRRSRISQHYPCI